MRHNYTNDYHVVADTSNEPDIIWLSNKTPFYLRPINGHPVTFFVNNNVVVAKIMDYCANDVRYDIKELDGGVIELGASFRWKDFMMTPHPFAKAKCDPRDTFDEEYGKQLAYKRLVVKYWSQYENRLGKVNDLLLKVFETNSKKMTKISESYLQRED